MQLSPPIVTLSWVQPYIAAMTISARHNPRLYAQQGQFLVTNVADLEAFIHFAETRTKERYLFAADVPASFAGEALEDLAFMGLTAGTMFPGLDGVGRMIRHEMSFKMPLLSLAADGNPEQHSGVAPSNAGAASPA